MVRVLVVYWGRRMGLRGLEQIAVLVLDQF